VINHEPIDGEITLHEMLMVIIDKQIETNGDDHEITQQTDIIQILQITMKESDHVMMDIMYLVNENGTQ
jgi:hypothetical protein